MAQSSDTNNDAATTMSNHNIRVEKGKDSSFFDTL